MGGYYMLSWILMGLMCLVCCAMSCMACCAAKRM